MYDLNKYLVISRYEETEEEEIVDNVLQRCAVSRKWNANFALNKICTCFYLSRFFLTICGCYKKCAFDSLKQTAEDTADTIRASIFTMELFGINRAEKFILVYRCALTTTNISNKVQTESTQTNVKKKCRKRAMNMWSAYDRFANSRGLCVSHTFAQSTYRHTVHRRCRSIGNHGCVYLPSDYI